MGKNLPRVSYSILTVGLLIFFSGVNPPWSIVQGFPEQETRFIQAENSCPTDVEDLTDLLLKDLPSYSNRVMQRARQISKGSGLYSYVLLAGRPEFEPLPLSYSQSQYLSRFPDTTKQIFFTTLERQYINNKAVQMQLYHWLFLVPTDQGWQLLTVFTRIGSSVPGNPPLPPKETSNGIIGQAVSLWLRDCQVGTIKNK